VTFGELFAGIGGFSLGLERAGMQCKWQVEIDPYAQAVLKKHWPEVPKHDDVRTFPPAHTHTHRISASISSAEAFHAKTSAALENVLDLQERGPVFGTSLLGSLASYDRDTSSWKTSQTCLFEGRILFSGSFPRSGMTRSGTLFRLRPLVLRTDGSGCGLWLGTPTAAMSIRSEEFQRQTAPTPAEFVRMYPTPTTKANQMCPSMQFRGTACRNLREDTGGGSLNPMWVEWLMGFPPGWTALDASETPLSRRSSRSSGGRSLKGKRG